MIKQCPQCSEKFESNNKLKKFCSPKCKTRSYYKPFICVICDNKFESKHPNRKYCSSKCQGEAQKVVVECTCDHCGDLFERTPHLMKKGKHKHFCSVECRQSFISENTGEKSYKWSKVIVKCEVCKEEIERQPSGLRDKVFCGKECYAHWLSENTTGENSPTWRGGADPHRGIDWTRIAEEIRERDGYVCTDCGSRQLERKHDVHHIIPWRFFSDANQANDPSNLITLCRSCHGKQESHKWTKIPDSLEHKVADIS